MARLPYSPETSAEWSSRAACMLSEIEARSGKLPADLEIFFQVGLHVKPSEKPDRAIVGKYWRRWKIGEKHIPWEIEQKIKYQACKLGWLRDEWLLDAIITSDNMYHSLTNRPYAVDIERRLKKIVQLSVPEIIEHEALQHFCLRLGDRLAKLYIVEYYVCLERLGEPAAPTDVEWAIAAVAQSADCLRPLKNATSAKKIEKYLKEVVEILSLIMCGEEALHCCFRLGHRLAELCQKQTEKQKIAPILLHQD